MPDDEPLNAAFDRLRVGTATDQDLADLRRILGNRTVRIDGDANGATIITGDGNVVLSLPGATPEAVAAALDALFPRALFQLPPPPREFTGRTADLADLLAHIGDGGATISGVRGMGGIGKTALSLVLADRIKQRYPDAQFYLDLKGTTQPLTPSQAMQHVIRGYRPAVKLPDEEAELRPLYHSLLDGQRILLLMDNARDAAQVSPLIPPPGCCLLVTSRWQFSLKGWHTLDLSTLPAQDARNLLLRLAPRIAAQADEIAQLCGRLPLALCLAAGALAARADLPVDQYIQKLHDSRHRLRQLDKYKDCTEEQLGVEASLELSYALLTPELQALWRALAVFPETFDPPAAAAVWDIKPDDARECLGDLHQHSMVEWEAPTDRYHLHDLARVFADAKLDGGTRRTACHRHAEHYLRVLGSAEEHYLRGGEQVREGLALFDLQRPNIEAGQQWAAKCAENDESAARLCSAYPTTGAYCLHLRQHPRRERVPWLEAAVAASRRLNKRRAEAWNLGNLGIAHADLGETRRAIECYEHVLQVCREIPDRLSEAHTLGNLGRAYADLGATRRAIEYYERALAIAREIGNRRCEGNALGCLGLAYADLGEIPRAIEFAEQHLSIARETGDRRGEHDALGNLGIACGDLGENHRAIEYHEQKLAITREIGDRRGEGVALGNLGAAYVALGEAHRAVGYHQQRLAIAREVGDRRGETAALGNLGAAYADLGEIRRAIEYHEQQLVIAREIGDRRSEGNACWNAALEWDELNERAKAIPLAQRALTVFEDIEDPHAPMVRGWLEQFASAD